MLSRNRKTRVLIVVDKMTWAIHHVAHECAKYFHSTEAWIVSLALIERDRTLFENLAQASDLLHLMLPYEYDRLRTICGEKPIVVTLHHCEEFSLPNIRNLGDASAILVPATYWKKFLETHGMPPERIVVVPYGVDANLMSPSCRSTSRDQLGIGDSEFCIGFFGIENKTRRKGSDIFLKAFSLLPATMRAQCTVVFQGFPCPELSGEVSKLGGRVIHPDFVEDIRSLVSVYNALDVYVITSRVEGGPLTLLEAMACQIPVVSTSVGMAIDTIENYRNGICVEEFSPELVSTAIQNIQRDRELACFLGRNGRVTAIRMSWALSAQLTEYVYNDVHRQSGRAESGTRRIDFPSSMFAKGVKVSFREDAAAWLGLLNRRGCHGEARRYASYLCKRDPFCLRFWCLRLWTRAKASRSLMTLKRALKIKLPDMSEGAGKV